MEVFRPRGWLRTTVFGAASFWVLVLAALFVARGVPAAAFAGALFFIAFFGGLGVFYQKSSIALTEGGIDVRGVASHKRVRYADVLRVEVTSGFIQTTYVVYSRGGFVHFTSWFGGHRRLAALVVERAGLDREA